jgi:general secretion pathway protein D
VHHNDDVSLALKVEVSNVSGEGFGGLPTFGNRYINTVIRLKDGETNMLAGLIRDDERRVLDGVAGLSDLPVIGRLFGRTKRETQETDIILTLTPHIVRVLDLNESDLAPFRLRREGGGAVAPDLPAAPPQRPAAADDDAAPGPVVPPAQRPATPILPPAPTPPPPTPPPQR